MSHSTTTARALPDHGAVITFDVAPAGSWARTGTAYRVERQGRTFRFENVANLTATFDRDWAVARSVWRMVEPAPISPAELRTALESLIRDAQAA